MNNSTKKFRPNIDADVVSDFGREWSRFDQTSLGDKELGEIFNEYFALFPFEQLPADSCGIDVGCGSGRWAQYVAKKVGRLIAIDPSSEALEVARRRLENIGNVTVVESSVDSMPLDDNSLDFAYSLGVLHHVPDTGAAIKSIAAKLKQGAPFLIYLYYAFDNRPVWFRVLWRLSDGVRRVVSVLPWNMKKYVCDAIALTVYWPLARLAKLLNRIHVLPTNWPLSAYKDWSLYTMRTDALDRFGTRLEQRYSRDDIRKLLIENGFENVRFSDRVPYWCALATRI